MRNLSLILLVLFAFACGSSDITDDPQIDLSDDAGHADADPGAADADPGAADADPGAADADPATPDASEVDATAFDAGDDRAQIFCDHYLTLCGYDTQNIQRFDDEATCLADFAGFDAAQQTCVEDQLDALDIDADLAHCRIAMGKPPCN